jgi:hypothetical protein|tara:strand:+ start:63 stop:269 length:207 start_codon:yes stop_codon:yes gene_type:complete
MVKRNSYGGKQIALNKLADHVGRSGSNSTAAVTDARASVPLSNGGMSQSMYEESVHNMMDDSQIRMTL